jgi:uncharacterized protein YjbI with pentapeptide repeats
MTAQSILARHLRPLIEETQLSNPRHWPGISIDLTAAVLVDFQMQNCSLASARFTSCVFLGRVRFFNSVFAGHVEFDLAAFTAGAWFRQANFGGWAWFSGTDFRGEVNLGGATFHRPAMFGGPAWFGGTKFRADVEFEGTQFTDRVELDGAKALAVEDSIRSWPQGWTVTGVGDDGWHAVVFDDAA